MACWYRLGVTLAVELVLVGCADSSGDDSGGGFGGDGYMSEDIPPQDKRDVMLDKLDVGGGDDGAGAGGSTGDDGGRPDDACQTSGGCPDGRLCAADFDGRRRGPFSCRARCIPTMDDASWCADDVACCDATATCRSRGYCVVDAPDTGTATGTGAATSGSPTGSTSSG